MKQAGYVLIAPAVALLISQTLLAQDSTAVPPIDYELAGPLIPATTTIVTAWDIPKNPLRDSVLSDTPLSNQIKWGFRLFMNTPVEGERFTANKLSCNNCNLNAGQREKAMPLVGIAAVYPEYNKRAGRLFSLEDRIVGCFERSENAAAKAHTNATDGMGASDETMPLSTSKEVLALSAYLTWLSQGYPVGENPLWRGHNVISAQTLIPVEKLDPKKGETLYKEKCSSCHGDDGQGVQIGDKKAGPLWGSDSWNDGAGAARIYTLAGIIRYAMPYLDQGSLTDEDAQNISAYINSQPRPNFPFKKEDYPKSKPPVDAVYYDNR